MRIPILFSLSLTTKVVVSTVRPPYKVEVAVLVTLRVPPVEILEPMVVAPLTTSAMETTESNTVKPIAITLSRR